MAASGAEVAIAPAIKPNSPNLQGKFGPRQSYSVRITGEGGRLNINWLVAGENPARIEMLRQYLEAKGIDLNERDRMIDCLLDWVDPDDLVRLNGAEASEGYQPANALLVRIDELKKVKGWETFTSTPGWDDELTVNSTGPVDLAWAQRDVLRALPRLPMRWSNVFSNCGRDQMGRTAQPMTPSSKASTTFVPRSHFPRSNFKRLSPFISFNDSVLRIVSTGRSNDITRVIQLVFRRAGTTAQLITWKEF